VERSEVFARDEYRCVYCGQVFDSDELTVDHVQPRVRRGDHSPGNVVTACRACNTRKGSRSIALFLADEPEARRHFFELATAVHARHRKAIEDELKGALRRRSGRGSTPSRG
jgi:5-methylcytosine-specific restriction endonuclease McrA